MRSHDIRASFLSYFKRNGHRVVPSSPLVPHEDPTLLFTNAGMNQFKDVLLGKEKRDYTRATTVQKCMRVSGKHNDLDNVGPSLRHHTFFEMLGNFSFGDYFKRDALPFAWELLTGEWNMPADRLYPTIFRGDAAIPRDDEAFDVWTKFVPNDRIGELGIDDNFWTMGDTGPCGRSSEIYYYRGSQIPCAEEAAGATCRGLECSCDRFIEIWNNVFMEFDRQPDGTLNRLPAPSIDTGMGFERVTAVLQGHLSNYDTDLFTPLLSAIGDRAGTRHGGTMAPSDVSMRVVADHMRAMTFLIADRVFPANEGRGYVLRKIMRRAMRHGKMLKIDEPFLYQLAQTVIEEYRDAYPELAIESAVIQTIIQQEEIRFESVLKKGLPRLEQMLDAAATEHHIVSGDVAFRLYDTHGVPLDFIEDMIEARHLRLDREGFERAMEEQREKARAKSTFKSGALAANGTSRVSSAGTSRYADWQATDEGASQLSSIGENVFNGYETTSIDTQIVGLFDASHEQVPFLQEGSEGFVALRETPFYVEAGGQVSDVGRLSGPGFSAEVKSVVRVPNWPRLHAVRVVSGRLTDRALVIANVAEAARDATRRNHTATHLLHAALRRVLGRHVKQAGSLVAPDRLRFDFLHSGPLTSEQHREIEHLVNEQILRNTPVQTEIKTTKDAMASGAMALFGEKYGDTVRVVSIPGFSVELCGGTHVRATGDIGFFVIESDSGVAAGTRRIDALTGTKAVTYFQDLRSAFAAAVATMHVSPDRAVEAIEKLQTENRRLGRELQQAKMKAALGGGEAGGRDQAIEVAGIKLVARQVSGLDKDGLRALVDRHRDQIKSGVVVLASPSDGKVSVVVGVTSDLTKKVPAGQVVKQLAAIVGGGGGGRPDFAEAGGKDASKIPEMLAASRGVIEKMLSA